MMNIDMALTEMLNILQDMQKKLDSLVVHVVPSSTLSTVERQAKIATELRKVMNISNKSALTLAGFGVENIDTVAIKELNTDIDTLKTITSLDTKMNMLLELLTEESSDDETKEDTESTEATNELDTETKEEC